MRISPLPECRELAAHAVITSRLSGRKGCQLLLTNDLSYADQPLAYLDPQLLAMNSST